MNLFTNISRTLILLVAGGLLFTSCTKEDLSNCPDGSFRVKFSYKDIDLSERTGIDPAKIKDVSLFVFDSLDNYIGTYTDTNVNFDRNYSMEITSLKPGKYRMLAWLNTFNDDYDFNFDLISRAGVSRDDMRLSLNIPKDDTVRHDIKQLFYGKQVVAVTGKTTSNSDIQTITIPVIENTNRLNITVEGINPTNSIYDFVITDDNGIHKFDNSLANCRQFYYKKESQFNEQGQLKASIMTLLLDSERSPILDVYKAPLTRTPARKINLVTLIEETKKVGATIDYENTYEYDITIRFETDTQLTITVNDWTYNIEYQELS